MWPSHVESTSISLPISLIYYIYLQYTMYIEYKIPKSQKVTVFFRSNVFSFFTTHCSKPLQASVIIICAMIRTMVLLLPRFWEWSSIICNMCIPIPFGGIVSPSYPILSPFWLLNYIFLKSDQISTNKNISVKSVTVALLGMRSLFYQASEENYLQILGCTRGGLPLFAFSECSLATWPKLLSLVT